MHGDSDDEKEEETKPKKYKRIKLENMLYNSVNSSEPYSYLDLKMGTDTVLRSTTSTSYAKFVKRDRDTTSAHYGFRLIGYMLYERESDKPFVAEHVVEDYEKTGNYVFVRQVFVKMLTDYDGNKAPRVVFDLLLKKIKALRTFIASIDDSRRLVNSSLFMVFDRDYMTSMNREKDKMW